MPKIVISYRHSDSTAIAGRISDKLRVHFGAEAVFMDMTSNRPGIDFRKQIAKALRYSDVIIAVIGRKWAGEARRGGRQRIFDDHDFIRIEIRTALESGIPVIPVLVDGATMPEPDHVPEDMAQLCFSHAAHVDSGRNFHRDMDGLIESIQALLNDDEGRVPQKRTDEAATKAGPRAPEVSDRSSAAHRIEEAATPPSFHPIRSRAARPIGLAVAVGLVATTGLGFSLSNGALSIPDLPGVWPRPKIDTMGGVRPLIVKPITKDALELRSIAFSPTDPTKPNEPTRMAVAGEDGVIRVWNTETFVLEKQIRARELVYGPPATGVHRIAFSALGDIIYSVGLDNKVEAFNWAEARHVGALEAEPNSNISIFLSLAVFPRKEPMNRWVAAGGDDGCFRIWHVNKPDDPLVSKYVTGGAGRLNVKCVQPVRVEKGLEIQTIAFMPGPVGPYAVGNRDGTIFLFSEQREPRSVRAHKGPVAQIEFSPDGESLASAGADGEIHIWKFADATKSYKTLSGHSNAVSSVAWSADGTRLATGSEDKTVRLWDSAAGRQIGEPFSGHRKDVAAIAFHPTRKWIISASQDGMLKVWDFNSRDALLTLIAYVDGTYIAYHRDGTFTGSSAEVSKRIIVSYLDGDIERVLPEEEKKKNYRDPELFAKALQGGT